MTSITVDPEITRARCEAWWNDGNRPGIRRNICDVSDGSLAKISAGSEIYQEYCWLHYFGQCKLPSNVRVPKLHGPLITGQDSYGDKLYFLPMEKIKGETIQQILERSGKIEDQLADDIIMALIGLRNAVTLNTGEVVPGIQGGLMQGPLFPPDNESPWTVTTVDDVKQIWDKLWEKSKAPYTWDLSSLSLVFTHLDISPANLIKDQHGSITILDFAWSGMYFSGYEEWILGQCAGHYGDVFAKAMHGAMARHELGAPRWLCLNLDKMKAYFAFNRCKIIKEAEKDSGESSSGEFSMKVGDLMYRLYRQD